MIFNPPKSFLSIILFAITQPVFGAPMLQDHMEAIHLSTGTQFTSARDFEIHANTRGLTFCKGEILHGLWNLNSCLGEDSQNYNGLACSLYVNERPVSRIIRSASTFILAEASEFLYASIDWVIRSDSVTFFHLEEAADKTKYKIKSTLACVKFSKGVESRINFGEMRLFLSNLFMIEQKP